MRKNEPRKTHTPYDPDMGARVRGSLFGRKDKHVSALRAELGVFERDLDLLRSRMDLGDDALPRFQSDRQSADYLAAFSVADPLVSVCIATYNRADLLVSRSLRSVLAQTYKNLDVVVVGDACTDHTEAAVRTLDDPRVRFINRATRGRYPDDPHLRWMVAGTDPINQALEMARGSFVTHLDDDDEHPPHRILTLLDFIREQRADLVWHPFDHETLKGKWERNEALEFRKNMVTTSAVFYHAWFKRIPWDPLAYVNREPGDWNRFRKFSFLGARTVRHPESLLRHFRERGNTQ